MSSSTTDADVVVIGAGSIGCAAARELSADHDVLVLEREKIAAGATGKASGLVSLQADYPTVPGAVRHARSFFEAYDGRRNVEYTPRPSVSLARPEETDDARAYAEVLSGHYDVTYLDGDALEARYPGVFDRSTFGGGIVFENTGWVDPYTFAAALARDAEARGGEIRTGVTVTGLLAEDGEVEGVETDEGIVRAPRVVAAAGWRTRELLAEHVRLPVRPERYQTVNLETDRGFDDGYPMGWAGDPFLYWRPEHNGDLHVGGGSRLPGEPVPTRERADEAFLEEIAEHVPRRLAGLGEVRVASEGVCPTGDALTPDRYPIVDAPRGAPEGLVIATGFSGYGIMGAPFAGAAVRSLAAGEDPPFPIGQFALDRFEDRSTDFEPPEFEAFDVDVLDRLV